MATHEDRSCDPDTRFKLLSSLADGVVVDKNIPPRRYFRSGLEMERMVWALLVQLLCSCFLFCSCFPGAALCFFVSTPIHRDPSFGLDWQIVLLLGFFSLFGTQSGNLHQLFISQKDDNLILKYFAVLLLGPFCVTRLCVSNNLSMNPFNCE